MAVALRVMYFSSARDLAVWVADAANNVASVHTILNDGERWVAFYTV